MGIIDSLEKMLAGGRDNALLRFGLGQAYLKEGDYGRAVEHLRVAVAQDPGYSAAWKLLAKALADSGADEKAIAAYEQGIDIAEDKGDVQAAKEMRVFLKRLRNKQGGAE